MVHGTYDVNLVLLSILIATVASYTGFDLAGRITPAQGLARYTWLVTAAAAMGGGIWSMHFVGMLAFSLPMPISYDLGLTLLSLVLPIVVTGAGFTVLNLYGTGAWSLLSGGVLMGLGIAAMHYTGMAAMRMAADVSYNRLWVAISVIIAIGAASTAPTSSRSTLARLPSSFQREPRRRPRTHAVSPLHYRGPGDTLCH